MWRPPPGFVSGNVFVLVLPRCCVVDHLFYRATGLGCLRGVGVLFGGCLAGVRVVMWCERIDNNWLGLEEIFVGALGSVGIKGATHIIGLRNRNTIQHEVVSVNVAGNIRVFIEGITPLNSPVRLTIHKCRLSLHGTSTRVVRVRWFCFFARGLTGTGRVVIGGKGKGW